MSNYILEANGNQYSFKTEKLIVVEGEKKLIGKHLNEIIEMCVKNNYSLEKVWKA